MTATTLTRPNFLSGIIPICFGFVFFAAEFALSAGLSLLSLAIYAMSLIALLAQSSLTMNLSLRRLLIALSFVPLIRIMGLTMPLMQFPILWRYVVLGVPIFAAIVISMQQLKIEWQLIGLTSRGLALQCVIGLLGIPLGFVLYRLIHLPPLIELSSLGGLFLGIPVLLIFTGILDALIFAGLIRLTATEFFGKSGIIFAGALFTLLHLYAGSLPVLAVVFVSSVGLYAFSEKTKSIVGAALVQSVANILLYLLLPLIYLR